MPKAEQITEPRVHHGEGPVWAADWGELRFVDMLAGDICSVAPDTRPNAGEVTRQHVGSVAAAFRPSTDGGMVVAVERGFALVRPDGSVETLEELWDDPGVRMNDGGCDPDGRFYCGSMAYQGTPNAGALWRLERDGSASVVLRDVTISNGLAWTPDGSTAYYIDTPTSGIDAFDYDSGSGLTNRRRVIDIPRDAGFPDGMTVDAEGYLWVALWEGAAVRRYSPDGRLDEVVKLPVPRVTACTFGGPDLSELYITTSRQGVPDDEQPEAGAVFRHRPAVRGLPVLPYVPA